MTTNAPLPPRPDDTKVPDEVSKVHRPEEAGEVQAPEPIGAVPGPTLDDVRGDERIRTWIRAANQQTGAIGYTEHGERHASTCAEGAHFILRALGHDPRRCEIAA